MNFQTKVAGICPSEPKQVSVLLIQSFTTNFKTRISLNLHFVCWGFLQWAITLCGWQGQQEPEMLLVIHTGHNFVLTACGWHRQKKNSFPSHRALQPFTVGVGKSFVLIVLWCHRLLFWECKGRGKCSPLPFSIRDHSRRGTAEATWAAQRGHTAPLGWLCHYWAPLLLPRWHHRQTLFSHPPHTSRISLPPIPPSPAPAILCIPPTRQLTRSLCIVLFKIPLSRTVLDHHKEQWRNSAFCLHQCHKALIKSKGRDLKYFFKQNLCSL